MKKTTPLRLLPACFLAVVGGVSVPSLSASDIVFPADAGVLDVTKPPYNAVPDDGVDDTAAIQAALNASGQSNRIVYLPPGVYNVSAQLNWPGTNGGTTIGKRTILQGAGKDRSILQFHNPSVTSGSVIVTGGGAAQNFRNGVRDLTVRIAPGNSATLNGVTFVANNQGTLRNVRIESMDRNGGTGLNLAAGENGPLLIHGVDVIGFNYGIAAGNTVASQTAEHVRLFEQKITGIRVHNQTLFIRGLYSRGQQTVAETVRDTQAMLALIDARLEGFGSASTKPAIFSDKTGYYRNIRSDGYQVTIKHDDKNRGNTAGVPGNYATEFLSHGAAQSAFSSYGNRSLGLEIRDTPEIPWAPLSQWRGPHQHGGIANDSADDTAAIQAAIATGASTIYLPNGTWIVNGTVTIPATVRRIIGCEAFVNGTGKFVVATNRGEPVVLERIQFGLSATVRLEHSGTRPVVLSSVSEMQYVPVGSAPGDLYIEDVNFNKPVTFRNQKVWARQLNQESDTQGSATYQARVLVDNATLWVLGLKTERAGTVIKAINNSQVEVLGAYILANTSVVKTDPVFEVINAKASFSAAVVKNFGTPNFETFVRETRGGTTLTLPRASAGLLYAAYSPVSSANPPVAHADSANVVAGSSVTLNLLANDTDADGDPRHVMGFTAPARGTVRLRQGLATYTPDPGHTGNDSFLYQIHDGKNGWNWAWVQVTTSASPGASLGQGLLGNWPMTEGSGLAASDLSNGQHLEFSGSGVSWGSDATGSFIQLANPVSENNHLRRLAADYSGLQAVSVVFWVKPGRTNNGGLVSWQSRSGGTYHRGFEVRFSSGRIQWELVNPATAGATSLFTSSASHPIPMNQWTHVVCVWDGSATRIYLNGVQAAVGTHAAATLGSGTAALRVGQTAINSQELHGGIANVLLYNRALTPAEIAHLAGL